MSPKGSTSGTPNQFSKEKNQIIEVFRILELMNSDMEMTLEQ